MGKISADITVAPEHHVYFDNLKLEIENKEGFFLSPISATPLVEFHDPFTNKNRDTLEGQASVTAQLHVPPTISLDPRTRETERTLDFALTYQVCSAKVCSFPKTLRVHIPVTIIPEVAEKSNTTDDGLTAALSKGTFWAYLFVFLGGLLTSFTPCIFPMIPITISIIGARSAHEKKSKAFFLSLFYVLGIAVTYSSLGIVAASTGAFFGSFLGNVWVVGTISLVFLLMGLSMLGLFEIQAPAMIRNRLGAAPTGSGYSGAFLVGLVSGIVASPCIGPVLVSILTYVAQTAKVFFGFTLLFTFAIGMGLIFIVLGTFSGLLSKLPKSGSWMNKIKILFGVILIGMSIYYIAPFLNISFKTETKKPLAQPGGVAWQNYSEQALKDAFLKHQPVIIDLWAEWCAACHELDEKTYVDPKVIEESKRFLMLKYDATHMTPETEAVLKKYNVLGLPTVIFIESNGAVNSKLTVTGFIPGSEFLQKMLAVKH